MLCYCFVCRRLVSCVPYVASFSGLSNFDAPSVFSNVYLSEVFFCELANRIAKLTSDNHLFYNWSNVLSQIISCFTALIRSFNIALSDESLAATRILTSSIYKCYRISYEHNLINQFYV